VEGKRDQRLSILKIAQVSIELPRHMLEINSKVRLSAILPYVGLMAVFRYDDVTLGVRSVAIGKPTPNLLGEDVATDDGLELVRRWVQIRHEARAGLNVAPAFDLDETPFRI
jgi:hypothetical protein